MLEIKDLHVRFHGSDHDAVGGISLTVADGQIMGLVGESGSGKTVTAMVISGLMPQRRADISGQVLLDGKDLLALSPADMRKRQGCAISVVFQEPMSAMNPVMRIGPQVEEALRVHTKLSPQERRERAPQAPRGGGLPDAQATTALDVTIQAQILELLRRLNREMGMSILFISHNLNVVRKLCSHVAVMEKGHIVETGETAQVFYDPQADYTKRLIAAIPTRKKLC